MRVDGGFLYHIIMILKARRFSDYIIKNSDYVIKKSTAFAMHE